MDRLQLQFSTTTHWASGIIRLFSHSYFSHVDAVITPGIPGLDSLTPRPYGLLGASDPGGVMIRAHNHYPFKTRRRITIVTDKADRIIELLASQIGKPFDSTAMGRVLDLNQRDWHKKDSWYCAELICWAFEEAEFFSYPLVVSKNRVTPYDLLLVLNHAFLDHNELNREVTDA